MRTFLLGMALCCGLTAATIPTGPAVGQVVPDFRLQDQNQRIRTLRSILGPKGALLLFYRSADWWPFCKGQLVELEQNAARIHAQGLGLAAISYDSVAILKQFADRSHIGFPLLSDSDSAVIRRYGILNETVAKDNFAYGIPHPGVYVLDRRGVVTAKYFEDDFRVRDTAELILLKQFGLQPPVQNQVDAKHATVRASAGAEELRPGQRVTLSLEVALPPRVHVYAPGVQGYKPAALSLTSKGFQPEAPVFPASKMLNLAAIHETVPVYQGRFRVLETVTLGNAQQVEPLLDPNRQLAIDGQFLYQACDDRECFVPETVPVKWTLKVMPFDRTRVPADLQRKAPQ